MKFKLLEAERHRTLFEYNGYRYELVDDTEQEGYMKLYEYSKTRGMEKTLVVINIEKPNYIENFQIVTQQDLEGALSFTRIDVVLNLIQYDRNKIQEIHRKEHSVEFKYQEFTYYIHSYVYGIELGVIEWSGVYWGLNVIENKDEWFWKQSVSDMLSYFGIVPKETENEWLSETNCNKR